MHDAALIIEAVDDRAVRKRDPPSVIIAHADLALDLKTSVAELCDDHIFVHPITSRFIVVRSASDCLPAPQQNG
jgi:hypothetical protein